MFLCMSLLEWWRRGVRTLFQIPHPHREKKQKEEEERKYDKERKMPQKKKKKKKKGKDQPRWQIPTFVLFCGPCCWYNMEWPDFLGKMISCIGDIYIALPIPKIKPKIRGVHGPRWVRLRHIHVRSKFRNAGPWAAQHWNRPKKSALSLPI